MKCPNCRISLSCRLCEDNSLSEIKPAPVCQKCKVTYEITIDGLKSELAEKQKLQNRAREFLKLDNFDRSMEIFKGDVAFVVHGCDMIHAHHFILNVRLWDAGEEDGAHSYR